MTNMTTPSIQIAAFDIERIRQDFPILHQQVNGHPLVYFDNAATTQKPNAVINAIVKYYREDNSNVHRGAHTLADRATAKFEAARITIARFMNATVINGSAKQVLWTRGTTEGINLVAAPWGLSNLKAGDRVPVPSLDHHSNIVPWQMTALEVGESVESIPVDANGSVHITPLEAMLNERVKMVSIA